MRRAFAVAAVALLSACGATGSAAKYSAATPASAKQLLSLRLKAEYLTVHWIACVRTGRVYRGAAIVRCNVNFGDPHIVAYCTVFRGKAAVTQFQNAAIPCGPDLSGPQFTITSSG